MKLVLYDMKVLSLVSTVTPVNSKAVIEHEILAIKKGNNFWLIYHIADKNPITYKSSYT